VTSSISNAAAVASSLDPQTTAGIIRSALIAFWALLYLIYTSIFGHRLQKWNYDTPGYCYNLRHFPTGLVAVAKKHPGSDTGYIFSMYFYSFLSLLFVAMRAFKISDGYVIPREFDYPLKGLGLTSAILYLAYGSFPWDAYAIVILRR
jgi:hypothetical protein